MIVHVLQDDELVYVQPCLSGAPYPQRNTLLSRKCSCFPLMMSLCFIPLIEGGAWIDFRSLLEQISTELVAQNNTNLPLYGSGEQKFERGFAGLKSKGR